MLDVEVGPGVPEFDHRIGYMRRGPRREHVRVGGSHSPGGPVSTPVTGTGEDQGVDRVAAGVPGP